jgi:DNA transformation protein
MPVNEGFKNFVLEQLSAKIPIEHKAMFGGIGLYSDAIFFGLIGDDTLFFKVDDSNRSDFKNAGTGPFRPYNDDRTMNYYEVPADVLEDTEQLGKWSNKALDVARAEKRKKKRK